MLPIIGIVLIPGILWGWVFYHAQCYKKYYLSLLLFLFVGGMISGIVALILNHAVEKYTLFWPGGNLPHFFFLGKSIPLTSSVFWFLVGINEEFAKLLVLLFVVFPSRNLEDPFDGILYAVVVSVGFAVMENFYYLDQFGVAVVVTRTVITIPAHAFMSVPMGFFVAKSRLTIDSGKPKKIRFLLPTFIIFLGWLFSSFLHGLYDFFLSLNMEREAYLQIFIMGCISFWLGKFSLRVSKNKAKV